MSALGRGLSAAGYAAGELYGKQALMEAQSEQEMNRALRLAEFQEKYKIAAEDRAVTRTNEAREAKVKRVDSKVDQMVGEKKGLIDSGIADRSLWTEDQQAAVDQSLKADRSDPMVRLQAEVQTGDADAEKLATVTLNERRADRQEKTGDQRFELQNKQLQQQIENQSNVLNETIRHNKATEKAALTRADKLSPAAKAQLEIASNGVASAHKELTIAARTLDTALKSGELDPEQKKATIAAAQAEFKAAKSAVDIANSHYNKVGQAHLGAEWKVIEAESPAEQPKATPTAADIDGLKKRLNDPKAVAAFEARFGADYTPKKEPAQPTKTEPQPDLEKIDPLQAKFDSETRLIETGKLRGYGADVLKWINETNARRDADRRSRNDKHLEEERRRAKERSRALVGG